MVNVPLIFLAWKPVTKLWSLTISGQCRGEPRDYVFAFLGGEFFTQFCLLEGNRVVVLIRTDCPFLLSMGHGNGLFACTVSGGDCVQPPRTLQAQTIFLCLLMGLGVFTAACTLLQTPIQFNNVERVGYGF